MVQSAVRVHVPVHAPQPISSTELPSYRCQSTNGAPKTPFGVPQTVQSRICQQDFMCKNRWCSEKSKNGAPKLSTLQWTNYAEIDIFCSDHDSKQTQREFSSVAALSKKLCALWFFGFCKMSKNGNFLDIAAEIGPLPSFDAREDI